MENGHHEVQAAREFGLTFSQEMLVANTIGIDPRYQRVLKKFRVKKIAEEFDPDIFGAIWVSERDDGSRVALDGQHRLDAIINEMGWGDQRVPCLVYRNLTPDQEAKIFERPQSTRATLTPAERFRARLFRGEPKAVEINRIVESHGFQVRLDWQGDVEGGIAAVSALDTIYDRYKPDTLDTVLGILRSAWGERTHGLTGNVLRGLAAFHTRYRGVYDRKRLIDVIMLRTPQTAEAESKDQQRVLGGTISAANARMLVQWYNHGMKKNRLDPYDMPASKPRIVARRGTAVDA